LRGRHRGSKPRVLTRQVEARILSWTRKPPTDGTTHWSTRRLGDKLGLPHTIVARAWKRAGLQPHRLERYLRSTDPNFEEKAAEIIGRYLDPPQHAAVFCVEEKTAIQALDRGTLVCQGQARSAGAGDLHVRQRPRTEAASLYRHVQRTSSAGAVGLYRSEPTDRVVVG
jgi:hypothetical protein